MIEVQGAPGYDIGMRVRCTDAYEGNTSTVGKVGTIVQAFVDYVQGGMICCVRFDDGQRVRGHGPGRLEWNIPATKLEVIG